MNDISDATRKHPSVTDLIYCLTAKFYDVQLGDKKPDFTNQTKLHFAIGLGLEKALLVQRKTTPTVGEFEGIHYHVDSLNGNNSRLMELKTTRVSSKKGFGDMPAGWAKQAMAYCKATGETVVEFAVIHLIEATMQCWRVEFEQAEIDTNWAWLQERKKVWDKALELGSYPKQYKYNQAWECKNCSYAAICEARNLAPDLGV